MDLRTDCRSWHSSTASPTSSALVIETIGRVARRRSIVLSVFARRRTAGYLTQSVPTVPPHAARQSWVGDSDREVDGLPLFAEPLG